MKQKWVKENVIFRWGDDSPGESDFSDRELSSSEEDECEEESSGGGSGEASDGFVPEEISGYCNVTISPHFLGNLLTFFDDYWLK